MEKFSEKELSVMIDDLQRDINTLSISLMKISSAAFVFFMANLLLIASIGIVLLNNIVQGGSYTHSITSNSTIAFIFFNGLSMNLLLIAIFNVNKAQHNEFLMMENPEENGNYYMNRIVKLEQAKEDMYEKLQMTANMTNASMVITGVTVIVYAVVLSVTYLF